MQEVGDREVECAFGGASMDDIWFLEFAHVDPSSRPRLYFMFRITHWATGIPALPCLFQCRVFKHLHLE